MKKVFIGLLVIAAGTAAFLFYRQQQKAKPISQTNQELIVGKWRIDSAFTAIPDDTIAIATLLLQNIPHDSSYKKTKAMKSICIAALIAVSISLLSCENKNKSPEIKNLDRTISSLKSVSGDYYKKESAGAYENLDAAPLPIGQEKNDNKQID